MPIGTPRKPQSLTRKNKTPVSSPLSRPSQMDNVLLHALGGNFLPQGASPLQSTNQDADLQRKMDLGGTPLAMSGMTPSLQTNGVLSQALGGHFVSQQRSPLQSNVRAAGLQSTIDSINNLMNMSRAGQLPAQPPLPPGTGPNNWRYPTDSPLSRSPAVGQSFTGRWRNGPLAAQASAITQMQQAESDGRGWMVSGSRGDVPFFVGRTPQEVQDSRFDQKYAAGLRDKALSPRGTEPMGYVDAKGQRTGTNRLGALRHLAQQNPGDQEVLDALANAESIAEEQRKADSDPARLQELRDLRMGRRDARKARSARQAQGLRNLFGYGPQSPLSQKATPQSQPSLVSPLSGKGSRTIEAQDQARTAIATAAATSPHIAGLGVGQQDGVVGLDEAIQSRLGEDPNAEFSDESLKAYQQWAQEHAKLSTEANDHFNFGGGPYNERRKNKWRELATLPDNQRSREAWMQEYRKMEDEVLPTPPLALGPGTGDPRYPYGMRGY